MIHITKGWKDLEAQGKLLRPVVPKGCEHNAHMYYIKLKDLETRSRFIAYLKERDIYSAFHYVPLHSSPAGQKFGRFAGERSLHHKGERTSCPASDVL